LVVGFVERSPAVFEARAGRAARLPTRVTVVGAGDDFSVNFSVGTVVVVRVLVSGFFGVFLMTVLVGFGGSFSFSERGVSGVRGDRDESEDVVEI
jgi:hypothetical protein